MPMIEPRYNLYKKKQMFRCVHELHQHFKDEMSPFHILVHKQCYPHGCIYFKWKCRLLAKKKKCFRNFEKVGRECFNCRYFYEEKIHQYPEFMNDETDFSEFNQSFEDFESWVENLRLKRIEIEGTVNFVSPELTLLNTNNIYSIRFSGFLVRFQNGFIDNVPFEDPFFLRISAITQQQLKIRRGDEIEFKAQIEIDRGRFRFIKSGSFTFYQRGEEKAPQKSDVLDMLNKSKIHIQQNVNCLGCLYGVLADIHNNHSGPRRALICLEGIDEPTTCQICEVIDKDGHEDACGNPKWKGAGCRQTV